MRRRVQVEPRRVIFIGVEGKSERAFARFLARCCEEAGLHLHLDVKSGSGGDSLSVVQEFGRRLERHPGRRELKDKVVLLTGTASIKTSERDATRAYWPQS